MSPTEGVVHVTTPDDLDLERRQLETQKLAAEVGKLHADTTAIRSAQSRRGQSLEWLKALAGLSAAITAIVALLGLWTSVARWQDESEQMRRSKEQEQVARAFDNLSADSPSRRLAGVASVRSYLATSNADQQQLILEVVISILAVEKEAIVRDSILGLIRELSPDSMNAAPLSKGLEALVRSSRTIVARDELATTRMIYVSRPPKRDTSEAIAQSVGEAITHMLRKGIRQKDLSFIYCVKCDFTGIDLSGVDFSNSILNLADFENARLVGANFDGADLADTRFVNANLQGAALTHREEQRNDRFRLTYVERLFTRERDPTGGANSLYMVQTSIAPT